MTFYLIDSISKKRLIISPSKPNKLTPVESVVARSWIDAKAKLGFPLTGLQQEILERG